MQVLSTGIINEPTAAAMAYSRQQAQDESRVLIFDFGGGTFDVSVVSVDGSLVEVKSSHGASSYVPYRNWCSIPDTYCCFPAKQIIWERSN